MSEMSSDRVYEQRLASDIALTIKFKLHDIASSVGLWQGPGFS